MINVETQFSANHLGQVTYHRGGFVAVFWTISWTFPGHFWAISGPFPGHSSICIYSLLFPGHFLPIAGPFPGHSYIHFHKWPRNGPEKDQKWPRKWLQNPLTESKCIFGALNGLSLVNNSLVTFVGFEHVFK